MGRDRTFGDQALTMVADAATARTTQDYATVVMASVRTVFGADEVAYSELELPTWTVGAIAAMPTTPNMLPGPAGVWMARPTEHPWVSRWIMRGHSGAVRLSDICPRRELRALAYYDLFYRPRAVEYWDYLVLYRTPRRVVGLSVGRRARDFSETETDRLEQLGRPLGAVWWQLQRVVTMRRTLGETVSSIGSNGDHRLLTAAECRVVRCVGLGWTNKSIAVSLGISIKAVEQHLTRVYRKMGVSRRVELALLLRDKARIECSDGAAGPRPATS